MVHVRHPSTWEAEKEDYKFKTSLDSMARPCLKGGKGNTMQAMCVFFSSLVILSETERGTMILVT